MFSGQKREYQIRRIYPQQSATKKSISSRIQLKHVSRNDYVYAPKHVVTRTNQPQITLTHKRITRIMNAWQCNSVVLVLDALGTACTVHCV